VNRKSQAPPKWTGRGVRYKIHTGGGGGQTVHPRFTIHHSRFTRWARATGLVAYLTIPFLASGQGRYYAGVAEVPYNGMFTFTRIRYGGFGSRRGGGAWAHDYPNADRNISTIIQYLSTIPINVKGTNVFDLEDPEIFRHPIIYISEPGFWGITEDGALALHDYLMKGGFLILDDFEADQWYNMEAQLKQAMPDHQLIEVGPDHPIFSSFFRLKDIYVPHPLVNVTPKYFALFENNDPKGRMLALVNYNSDLAEYWEWSADGFFPVEMSNEAYKLGVNYIYYALIH